FECLDYLLRHRDRAVGRDELVEVVFARSDVSDAQLAQIILRTRRAVGDDGHRQHSVRTVPRFGFRWTATTVEEPVVEAPVVAEPATERRVEPVPPHTVDAIPPREQSRSGAAPPA